LAAFDVSSENGGGAPGSNTLVASDVVLVVEDETSVELVASGRVVAVVLLVTRWVVEVLDDVFAGNVVDVVAKVVVTAPTTTVPRIPELW
jgi:hypothetical protein